MENEKKTKKEIPVFFSADENYLPFLSVTLTSLLACADENRKYHVHVLTAGACGEKEKEIKKMQKENFRITFHNVSKKQKQIEHLFRCRDYYTSAIYYRLFIPELFPQYEKAVYLDCDVVLLQDVAKLFDYNLKGNLVGAVADGVVAQVPAFKDYVKNALGIPFYHYFNSGVLVMNLQKMRETGFCEQFSSVLESYEFIVAPDQDCLNLICKNKVLYLPNEWNAMPVACARRGKTPALVHYNLSMKPWHYSGVLYEDYFWSFAKQTAFYSIICEKKQNFSEEMKARDKRQGEELIALAQAEADSDCNYLQLQQQKNQQNEGGRYAFNEENRANFLAKSGNVQAY